MYILLQVGTIGYMYVDVAYGGLFQSGIIIFANASIWVPQIISNLISTKYPKPPASQRYTVALTIHLLHFQIYTKLYSENLFHMHVDTKFAFLLAAWFLLQYFVHKISLLNPREWTLENIWENRLGRARNQSDNYKYCHSFEAEAQDSHGTQFSCLNQDDEYHQLPVCKKKVKRQKIRQKVLESTECIICMQPLGVKIKTNQQAHQEQEHLKTFVMTPCKHKYHKECLLQWIGERQHCPICRGELPGYHGV